MHLNRSRKIFLFIYCRMQEAVHSKKLMQSGSFPIWLLLSPNTLCWAPLLPTPALICSNKGIKMACILRVDTSVESQIAKKAWLIRVSWFCYSCAPFLCHQLSVADVTQIGRERFSDIDPTFYHFYFYPSLWIFQICIDPTFDHFWCRTFFSPKLMYKPPRLTKLICEHFGAFVHSCHSIFQGRFPYIHPVGWLVGRLVGWVCH